MVIRILFFLCWYTVSTHPNKYSHLFCFHSSDYNNEDVFVHSSAIIKNNPNKYKPSLSEGEPVEFDILKSIIRFSFCCVSPRKIAICQISNLFLCFVFSFSSFLLQNLSRSWWQTRSRERKRTTRPKRARFTLFAR